MDIILIRNAYNYFDKKVSDIEDKIGDIGEYRSIWEQSNSDLEQNYIKFYDGPKEIEETPSYNRAGLLPKELLYAGQLEEQVYKTEEQVCKILKFI